MRTNKECFESWTAVLTFVVDCMRLDFAAAQSSSSPAAFQSSNGMQDQHLCLPRSLDYQYDHLHSSVTNLLVSSPDSRSTLFCGAGTLLREFGALLDTNLVRQWIFLQ